MLLSCACCAQIYRNKLRAEIEGKPFEVPAPSSVPASTCVASAPSRNRSYSSLPKKDEWDDWGAAKDSGSAVQVRLGCSGLYADSIH